MLSRRSLDAVAAAVTAVGNEMVLPHAGLAGEVEEKTPGEVVTAIDREAEAELTRRLTKIERVAVVGEESTAEDPETLERLGDEQVWIVDPLDGTANFIDGSPDYAVMVALAERGETVASWMYRPADGFLFTALRGTGAFVDGERLECEPSERLRGIIKTRFLPDEVRATIDANEDRFDEIQPGANCAAVDYPLLVGGALDFILYWRTLPWDHAPGSLFAREAGGVAKRLDGADYQPDQEGDGLLVATDLATWQRARSALFDEN